MINTDIFGLLNPAYISLEVTAACNHRCIYCYNENALCEHPKATDEELCRITDFIISKKPICVTLSGGEVLLMFDGIRPYIDKILSNGSCVRILTNGTLITDEMAEYFAERGIHLLVSFPCVKRDIFEKMTGSASTYDSAVNGMKLLKKHGVVFSPNVVVTTLNLHWVKDTVIFLQNEFSPSGIFVSRATAPVGASEICKNALLDNEQLQELFDICVSLSKKRKILLKTCGGFPLCVLNSQRAYDIFGKVCGAGKRDFLVTASGDIRLCSRDSLVYGNIFRDSFEELAKNMSEIRKQSAPSACLGCGKKDICRGGCHMSSAEDDRNLASLDYNADPNNVPVKYKVKRKKTSVSLFKTYRLNIIQAVELNGLFRIAVGMRYDCFPYRVYRFISEKGEFGFFDLKKYCRMSFSESKSIMSRLKTIGAISEISKAEMQK